MDSLEWSKKFEVLSISRLVLHNLGFTPEQISQLADDDMQAIADGLQEELSKAVGGFAESVKFMVRLYLAERHTDNRTGGTDGTTTT